MRASAAALLLLLCPAARANEAALAAETVAVAEVPAPIAADPAAAIWERIPALAVPVAPQRTIRLHDKKANEALATAATRTIAVRAATDGRDLAIWIAWSDATEDLAADETDVFGDAAALQFPLRFGAGTMLPYVGMGDDALPVALYLQRAARGGPLAREAVAKGFGSSTRAELGGVRVAMRHDAGRAIWRAVFVRPITTPAHDLAARGLVPFAVAVWDGARNERGGNKSLSGWKLLRMPRQQVDPAYASELAWGRGPDAAGDLARGKRLVETICAACHVAGERRTARPGIAPDLSAIGAIATPAYLRDSIVAPSAVLVPDPNTQQHQDRAKPVDAMGAYPRSEAFVWSRRDAGGKLVSKMPTYASLPADDVKAIVAYLMTLGAAQDGAGRKP